jgi:Putative peptidoglycan binding domain
MSSILVSMNVKAPTPQLHFKAAELYNRLRGIVNIGAGFDFLAKSGDMLRPSNFMSKKDGVANRSWHKTGRAFDYDQECKHLIIVSEIGRNRKQFFRTFLICAKQDGSLGNKRTLRDMRGFTKTAFVFDFTEAAETVGFKRIPAWNGWQSHYNRREFWHYQFDEDLTWDAAMLQLRGKTRTADDSVIGLNDRGENVRQLQARLVLLGLLKKADGVFGKDTKDAVEAFQRTKDLDADGIIGPKTRALLLK